MEYVTDISDERLKKCRVFANRSEGISYLSKERVFESQTSAAGYLKIVEAIKANPNKFVVPIVDFEYKVHNLLCSTNYSLAYFIPQPRDSLQTLLSYNKGRRVAFSDGQLTDLLYQSVAGLAHLHTLGLSHGALSPLWIVSTRLGYAVLEDPLREKSTPTDLSNLNQIYASPQRYAETLMRSPGTNDKQKSDVFSLGLVLLECGTLTSVGSIFVKDAPKIEHTELQSKIQLLEAMNPGNSLFTSTVTKMLEVEEANRPTAQKIISVLPSYDLVKSYLETTKGNDSEISGKRDHSRILPADNSRIKVQSGYSDISSILPKQSNTMHQPSRVVSNHNDSQPVAQRLDSIQNHRLHPSESMVKNTAPNRIGMQERSQVEPMTEERNYLQNAQADMRVAPAQVNDHLSRQTKSNRSGILEPLPLQTDEMQNLSMHNVQFIVPQQQTPVLNEQIESLKEPMFERREDPVRRSNQANEGIRRPDLRGSKRFEPEDLELYQKIVPIPLEQDILAESRLKRRDDYAMEQLQRIKSARKIAANQEQRPQMIPMNIDPKKEASRISESYFSNTRNQSARIPAQHENEDESEETGQFVPNFLNHLGNQVISPEALSTKPNIPRESIGGVFDPEKHEQNREIVEQLLKKNNLYDQFKQRKVRSINLGHISRGQIFRDSRRQALREGGEVHEEGGSGWPGDLPGEGGVQSEGRRGQHFQVLERGTGDPLRQRHPSGHSGDQPLQEPGEECEALRSSGGGWTGCASGLSGS